MTDHDCPIGGCQMTVPYFMLMCKPHWKLVPRPLQLDVYAAWKDGQGADTEEHRAACGAAVDAVHAITGGL